VSKLTKLAKVLVVVLDLLTVGSAFTSAYHWHQASWDLPPPGTCFDGCPPTDPFQVALKQSAEQNREAAKFAGAAALTLGLATLLRMFGPR